MSSASARNLSDCTCSAPNPLITRTPAIVSSTTVASCACSDCTANTAGWIADENLVAVMLTSGSGASATRARNGSVMNKMTTTPATRARFEIVSGIITTNACTWLRSLDERLISCPVWARS